ncbi:MAG: sulfurtransferase TusA family protein [Coriobacteriia bacterium]|nr:sulfurtransferase TusA family protein [Coriobacteriia bacterium]MBN2821768.1 sulfurtransferase TusA family protein [Coriobacteriia bacterium]
MVEVDVRGFVCPVPLMRTKKALESEPTQIVVFADDGTAKTNVTYLLQDEGYAVVVTDDGDDYRIEGNK